MSKFRYMDAQISREPTWGEGMVVPLSGPAKIAKMALDQTNHVVLSKTYKEKVQYIDVDLNKVESLLKSIRNERMLQMIVGGEIDRIVIGRDMWREVTDQLVERPFSFLHEMYIVPAEGMRHSLYGIPVQVLPNIQGYLIIPKFNPINTSHYADR